METPSKSAAGGKGRILLRSVLEPEDQSSDGVGASQIRSHRFGNRLRLLCFLRAPERDGPGVRCIRSVLRCAGEHEPKEVLLGLLWLSVHRSHNFVIRALLAYAWHPGQMDPALPHSLKSDFGLSKTGIAQSTSAWCEEPHFLHLPTVPETVPGAVKLDQTNLCCYCFTRRADHLIIEFIDKYVWR